MISRKKNKQKTTSLSNKYHIEGRIKLILKDVRGANVNTFMSK